MVASLDCGINKSIGKHGKALQKHTPCASGLSVFSENASVVVSLSRSAVAVGCSVWVRALASRWGVQSGMCMSGASVFEAPTVWYLVYSKSYDGSFEILLRDCDSAVFRIPRYIL